MDIFCIILYNNVVYIYILKVRNNMLKDQIPSNYENRNLSDVFKELQSMQNQNALNTELLLLILQTILI